MKKLIALLTLLCLCFSFYACGKKNNNANVNVDNDNSNINVDNNSSNNNTPTHETCVPGNDGFCKVCGKATLPLSFYISQPFDTNTEIKEFIDEKYAGKLYVLGNFRLLYTDSNDIYLFWGATNISEKTVKEITYTISYYTIDDNLAYDDITKSNTYTGKISGPIGASKSFFTSQKIGNGASVHYGKITEVTIEFLDGSTVTGDYNQTTWHNDNRHTPPNLTQWISIEK